MTETLHSTLQLQFNQGEGKAVKLVTYRQINEAASNDDVKAVATSVSTLFAYPLAGVVRHNAIRLGE